ncbi:chemotaxis protein CheW, partial [Vibrio sp. D420a]|uniref:chemotaxis protein CheW n=1 Tax=Vibrio sp. D420a TaxID=2836895 RepID=UPI002555EF0D
EPEPEPKLAEYSSYSEIRSAEFEVPNLEDVQKLLSQLESTNVVEELNLDDLMDQNTQQIALHSTTTVDMPVETDLAPKMEVASPTLEVETPEPPVVEQQAEEEIQSWDIEEPLFENVAETVAEAEPQVFSEPVYQPSVEAAEETVSVQEDLETVEQEVELETQAGGASNFTSWESTVRSEDFQVLYFDVNGVTFAVPLDELGGIHRLEELSHLIGRPAWYLGLQSNRDSQLDVVDTAKWVMSEKLTSDEYKENYQYIVMLGESMWGLASTELKGTELLNTDKVRWREMAGKRPWLAGMVKEKMCALIHVEALIAMLNAGLDVKALD